jgi:hypothetical protein
MNRIHRYSAIVAIVVLVSGCVRSALLEVRSAVDSYRKGTLDFAVAYGRRIQGVKSLLPPDVTVGYVSDQSDLGEYFLTQYFLVPLVVVQGDRADFLVVNNHPADASGKPPGPPSVSEIRGGPRSYDFGDGIRLVDQRPSR